MATCAFREGKRATKEPCLPPGSYRFVVVDGDRELAAAEVAIAAAESTPLRLELR